MKFISKKLLATTIFATAISTSATADDNYKTIADQLYNYPELSTTKNLVVEADLAQSLGELQVGDFTVFAANNSAYDDLSEDELKFMKENKNIENLQDLLGGHIVADKIELNEVKDGERIVTINNDKISIEKEADGDVYVDGAKVIKKIEAYDGVIYVIDDVINDDFMDAIEDLAYLQL